MLARAAVIALAALLTACGGLEPAPAAAPGPDPYARVLTVPVSAGDDAAEVAARYDAELLVWRPADGVALLGLRSGSGLALQGAGDASPDALAAPEVSAGGVSVWSGGVSVWSGGVSVWSGGVSVWSGGTDNPFPGNEDVWTALRVGDGQARVPELGRGTMVAVIDTGVDLDHVALQGKFAPASLWRDFVDGDDHPDEEGPTGAAYGHGTAVAGVVLQVAPEATILPLRVLAPDGSGDLSAVVQAIDHALSAGADVINLSLGSLESSQALEAMIASADAAGVPVVASSGNTGDTRITYPAALARREGLGSSLLGIGSVDVHDVKSAFSTYGPELELVAPGEGVTSLYPDDRSVAVTGTSFSAPWVSGAVALALSATEKGAAYVVKTATDKADSIDELNPAYEEALGYGRVDITEWISKATGR